MLSHERASIRLIRPMSLWLAKATRRQKPWVCSPAGKVGVGQLSIYLTSIGI
jgi:hypothetical protein